MLRNIQALIFIIGIGYCSQLGILKGRQSPSQNDNDLLLQDNTTNCDNDRSGILISSIIPAQTTQPSCSLSDLDTNESATNTGGNILLQNNISLETCQFHHWFELNQGTRSDGAEKLHNDFIVNEDFSKTIEIGLMIIKEQLELLYQRTDDELKRIQTTANAGAIGKDQLRFKNSNKFRDIMNELEQIFDDLLSLPKLLELADNEGSVQSMMITNPPDLPIDAWSINADQIKGPYNPDMLTAIYEFEMSIKNYVRKLFKYIIGNHIEKCNPADSVTIEKLKKVWHDGFVVINNLLRKLEQERRNLALLLQYRPWETKYNLSHYYRTTLIS